jgi:hypothetical protein
MCMLLPYKIIYNQYLLKHRILSWERQGDWLRYNNQVIEKKDFTPGFGEYLFGKQIISTLRAKPNMFLPPAKQI